jgi:hypothetical protein
MDAFAIACNLTPEELRKRGADLLPGLVQIALERRPIVDGYAFRFAPDPAVLESVVSIIKEERECCPFFRFQLTWEPAAGPVWLSVSGPVGTREFIEGFLPARTT